MLEQGLTAQLYATPAVVACLADASSIYPVMLPQDANLPALVYRRISSTEQPLLNTTGPPLEARIQFEAWSQDYLETLQVKAAVLACLVDFTGQLPDADLTVVRDIVHDTEADDFSDSAHNFCAKFDVFVTYLQS